MNSQTIFAALRDALAELYPDVQDARVVVDDAGLDAKQIAFSTRAQTNWHNILTEAVRQTNLDVLLDTVLTIYGDNSRLKNAFIQYRYFINQGGYIGLEHQFSTLNISQSTETGSETYIVSDVNPGAHALIF